MYKIALLGYGTVGQGVYRIWDEHNRLKKNFEIVKILVRDRSKIREVDAPESLFTTDPEEIFSDPSIDIIVELTGNVYPMTTRIIQSLQAGKHVVTANKALVSHSFEELSRVASEKGVHFLYEASVAGGIPVLKTLKDLTKTNRITQVDGILNGTCNFILSQMGQKGEIYADALKDAQELGFAEADPTADVSGQDTMRKLRILSSLAYRGSVREEDIPCRGIDTLGPTDMRILSGLGRTVKLLGLSKRNCDEFTAMVVPAALPSDDARAKVQEAGNVVHLLSDNVGWLQFMGPGAGMLPTANAVWTDLVDVLENRQPIENPLGKRNLINRNAENKQRYYLRVEDKALVEQLQELGLTSIEGEECAFLSDPVSYQLWSDKTQSLGDAIHWVLWVE